MKVTEINYEPLKRTQNISFALIESVLSKNEKIFAIVAIGLGVLFVILSGDLQVFLYVVIGLAVLAGRKFQKLREDGWVNFAAANGWSYTSGSGRSEYVPPSIKGIGDSWNVGKILQAQVDGHTWNLLMYQYTVGSGKNSQTYYHTIVHIPLEKSFPYIALDSKGNGGGLKNVPDGCEQIKLEGNFNEQFKMYIQSGAHVDALSVISPDVMQVLIDKNLGQDIEIIDKNLYFIVPSSIWNVAVLKGLLESVDALEEQIRHRLNSINYTAAPEHQAALAQAMQGTNKYKGKVLHYIYVIFVVLFAGGLFTFMIITLVTASQQVKQAESYETVPTTTPNYDYDSYYNTPSTNTEN